MSTATCETNKRLLAAQERDSKQRIENMGPQAHQLPPSEWAIDYNSLDQGKRGMPCKKHKPEEIIGRLCESTSF